MGGGKPLAHGPAHKGRLLVVDDAPSVRRELALWLAQTEYRCVWVRKSEKVPAMMRRHRFDAVVYGLSFSFHHPSARAQRGNAAPSESRLSPACLFSATTLLNQNIKLPHPLSAYNSSSEALSQEVMACGRAPF